MTIPALVSDDWDVVPPPGWEPVAAVCRGLYGDRDAIVRRINEKAQAEIDAFRPGNSVITTADLEWSTGHSVANFLRGVAECRHASEEDLAFQRLVGQRSAIRGLPLRPLIASFELGFRELWATVAHVALESGGEASRLLLEGGSTVWERLNAVSSSVAEGYKAELARRSAFETAATAHFIETLQQEPLPDDARALAVEIGFDPEGRFRVLEVGGPIEMADIVRGITARLQASGAVASAAQRGRVAVVIVQGAKEADLTDATAAVPEGAAVGVGTEVSGLVGARASMRAAEHALALALMRGRSSTFEDDWLLAVVYSQRDSVQSLLTNGISLARSNPHLTAALRSFAESSFSVAESARILQISPTSMRYRLTRWRTLTGWDPWTFDGLSRSLLALEMAGTEEPISSAF